MKRFAAILLFCLCAVAGWAATAVPVEFLLTGIRTSTGAPVAYGYAYFYAAGTTTPKAIYLDAAMASPATNPVTLDSNGRAVIFANGRYKVVIKTAAAVTVFTVDGAEYLPVSDFASDTTNPFGSTLDQTTIRGTTASYTNFVGTNATFTGAVAVPTPTLAGQAANKTYVDLLNGLSVASAPSQTTTFATNVAPTSWVCLASSVPLVNTLAAQVVLHADAHGVVTNTATSAALDVNFYLTTSNSTATTYFDTTGMRAEVASSTFARAPWRLSSDFALVASSTQNVWVWVWNAGAATVTVDTNVGTGWYSWFRVR